MDLKADDALNVDIDPDLLLSYELEKLNLDEFKSEFRSELNLEPNDYFDQFKLTDECPKNDDKLDSKNDFTVKDIKNESTSMCIKIKTAEKSAAEEKVYCSEIKVETPSDYSEIKKDINGNDESVSEENLNKLFVELDLSDSDNEEVNDIDHLKERGPVRSRRYVNKNKDANNLWYKNEGHDKSQFDSERLKFLSGSNQIHLNGSELPNNYAVYNNIQSTIYGGIEPSHNLSSQESFFEDARAVSSPESGYDSSSPHSITGSPPPVLFTSSVNLDFIPETVDEQNILDFLIENTDSALIDNNLAVSNTDDKDAKGKITEIINFLKDIPSELSESSNVATISHPVFDVVPSTNHTTVLNTDVRSSPILCNTISKIVETPKKLVPKLKEEAKKTLRQFLSKEKYYDVSKRLYEKVREDEKSGKKISVIFIEDEMDKDSKKRTNLHNAVLNEEIEEIFSIVEIHKQYDLPFADINIRDKQGKTALDYAIQKEKTLVVDYLKENTACQSVNIKK